MVVRVEVSLDKLVDSKLVYNVRVRHMNFVLHIVKVVILIMDVCGHMADLDIKPINLLGMGYLVVQIHGQMAS